MNLDIFTMMKLVNLLVNKDQYYEQCIDSLKPNETRLLSNEIQIYQIISLAN
jgi:hypothetical protein